jgi:RNA polymerase sigma-70 factor (ECF subfamily)
MRDEDLPEIPIPADLDRAEVRELVRRTLHQLPPDQREALVLHYVWGLSYGEIGRSLGVLAGTVKLRAFRGLRQARRLLGLVVTGDDQQANR